MQTRSATPEGMPSDVREYLLGWRLHDMDGRVPMDIADNYTQMTAEVEAVLATSGAVESED